MLAYSYTRISTSIQIDGHGLKRQKGFIEKYCKANGLTLAPDHMQDIASGYHADHLKKGALRLFIEKLEAGAIPTPCALVIEALDRLSRQKPMQSLRLLWDIVESGVEVHTTTRKRVYTAGMGMSEMMDSLIHLFTAHEESEKKSERHLENWEEKRVNAKTRIMTKTCPCWLKPKPDKSGFIVIEERADIIRTIFKMTANGVGKTKIVDHLNNQGIKPFSKAKRWHASYVQKLMDNRNVLGHLATTKRVDGKPTPGPVIEDYYERIIDDDLWKDAHENRAARTPQYNRYGPTIPQDMIKGLLYLNGLPARWRNAGKRWGEQSNWSITYRTFDPQTGKRVCSVNRRVVELQLLHEVVELDPTKLIPAPTADPNKGIIDDLNTQIEETQAAIDRMVDALASGVSSAAIAKKIAEKEKSLERAKGKLKTLTKESAEKEMLTEKLPAVLEAVQEMDISDIKERIITDSDIELRLTTSRHLHELLERVDFYIGLENCPPHIRRDFKGFDPSKGTKTLKYEDYTAYALIAKFRSGAVVERAHFYSPLETVDEVF
jgi:DNA invertase Pin-like site-specific DNA recombinase